VSIRQSDVVDHAASARLRAFVLHELDEGLSKEHQLWSPPGGRTRVLHVPLACLRRIGDADVHVVKSQAVHDRSVCNGDRRDQREADTETGCTHDRSSSRRVPGRAGTWMAATAVDILLWPDVIWRATMCDINPEPRRPSGAKVCARRAPRARSARLAASRAA